MSLKKMLDEICDRAGDDGEIVMLALSGSGPMQGPLRYAKDADGNRYEGVYQLLVNASVGNPRAQPQLIAMFFEAEQVLSIMKPMDVEQPRIVTPPSGIHVPS